MASYSWNSHSTSDIEARILEMEAELQEAFNGGTSTQYEAMQAAAMRQAEETERLRVMDRDRRRRMVSDNGWYEETARQIHDRRADHTMGATRWGEPIENLGIGNLYREEKEDENKEITGHVESFVEAYNIPNKDIPKMTRILDKPHSERSDAEKKLLSKIISKAKKNTPKIKLTRQRGR